MHNGTTNATPTTNATALVNNAIDLGLTICECPIGDGFLIVSGLRGNVEEWVNGTPGVNVVYHCDRANTATAAREVRA